MDIKRFIIEHSTMIGVIGLIGFGLRIFLGDTPVLTATNFLLFWLPFFYAVYIVAESKNRPGHAWVLLGFLVFPFLLLIILPYMRKMPDTYS